MLPSIFMVITVLYTSVPKKKYLDKLNEPKIGFNHPQIYLLGTNGKDGFDSNLLKQQIASGKPSLLHTHSPVLCSANPDTTQSGFWVRVPGDEQSHPWETCGQNPTGGRRTVTPKKSRQEQEGEESVHFHKGPLRGKSPSWVVKAVTKPPAIISLVLAAGGCTHTAVCSASSASQQHHAPQEPRTKTTDRRTVVH